MHDWHRKSVRTLFFSMSSTILTFHVTSYDDRYWNKSKATLMPSSREAKLLIPTLQIVARIAVHNNETCQTVIEAGVLEMLLRIYVIFPSFSQSALDNPEPWTALLKSCRSLLLLLSRSSRHRQTILRHPISILWTDCAPIPPPYSEQRPPVDEELSRRCIAWRQASRSCIKRRISTIYIGCLWRSNVHEIENFEACMDLVEFVRYGSQ